MNGSKERGGISRPCWAALEGNHTWRRSSQILAGVDAGGDAYTVGAGAVSRLQVHRCVAHMVARPDAACSANYFKWVRLCYNDPCQETASGCRRLRETAGFSPACCA